MGNKKTKQKTKTTTTNNLIHQNESKEMKCKRKSGHCK
jgi:hypothetical protein